MATDRQTAFAARLIAERGATAYASLDLGALSVAECSRIIDELLALPAPQATHADGAPCRCTGNAHSAAALPDVPEGRYAIGEPGATRFYRVDRPTEGKWAGRTFVSAQASDDLHPVRDPATRRAILEEIARDTTAALRRYGAELGSCGHCGRTLTDAESRAYGIGPVCRERLGLDLATVTAAEPTADGRTLWTISYGGTPVSTVRA